MSSHLSYQSHFLSIQKSLGSLLFDSTPWTFQFPTGSVAALLSSNWPGDSSDFRFQSDLFRLVPHLQSHIERAHGEVDRIYNNEILDQNSFVPSPWEHLHRFGQPDAYDTFARLVDTKANPGGSTLSFFAAARYALTPLIVGTFVGFASACSRVSRSISRVHNVPESKKKVWPGCVESFRRNFSILPLTSGWFDR